jgi:hypothetical protein
MLFLPHLGKRPFSNHQEFFQFFVLVWGGGGGGGGKESQTGGEVKK